MFTIAWKLTVLLPSWIKIVEQGFRNHTLEKRAKEEERRKEKKSSIYSGVSSVARVPPADSLAFILTENRMTLGTSGRGEWGQWPQP